METAKISSLNCCVTTKILKINLSLYIFNNNPITGLKIKMLNKYFLQILSILEWKLHFSWFLFICMHINIYNILIYDLAYFYLTNNTY